MSKITLSFMQRFMGKLDTAIRNFVGNITGDLDDLQTTDKSSLVNAINEAKSSGGASNISGLDDVTITDVEDKQVLKYNSTNQKWENKADSSSATYKTATLTAGNTSVIFTGIPTTGNNIIEVFTSQTDLDYESLDDSVSGSLTVYYEAQSSNVTVYLRIEGVTV